MKKQKYKSKSTQDYSDVKDKIAIAISTPNKRSCLSNIAIPSEENVKIAKEWSEYNKL